MGAHLCSRRSPMRCRVEGKWIYEPKLDGVRGLILSAADRCGCTPRIDKPLNGAYPELVEALEPAVRGDAVLDGEIVAFDPERDVTSFSRLQQRMQLRDPVRARRSAGARSISTCSIVSSMRAWISPACR